MGYKTYTCPYARKCGGCEWLAVPYALQLERKQEAMEQLFRGIIAADHATLEHIVGMESPKAYRYKAATPFAPGHPMRSGFFERGTHRIVACKNCLVEATGTRQILTDVARAADDTGILAYREDRGDGILRHAVVRVGYATGEILLTIVTNGEELPRKNQFVRRIRKYHPEITSIVQNVNDKRTNAILGTRNITLYGDGTIQDILLGSTFEIGPTSFYQTNPQQTEALYRLALEVSRDASTLLDAYCGTGTIGICAAALARREDRDLTVVGVERDRGGVSCAERNARANGLGDLCSFVRADCTNWMARQKTASFDAAILDPPRAGSTLEFLNGLAHLAPEVIAYVSCNPTTQVRDLKILRSYGYKVYCITPVDMFPHTRHVETVVLMSRVKD